MGMTIDDSIKKLLTERKTALHENKKAFDFAIETMRKYQKIEDIYYHQRSEALENSLRAVIEDGKID